MSRLDIIKAKAAKLKASGSKDKYTGINVAALEKAGITQYKKVEGANFFYIVPPADMSLLYELEFHTHKDIGVDRNTYRCGADVGKPCPACDEFKHRQAIVKEARATMSKPDGDRLYMDVASPYKQQVRHIILVLDCKDPDTVGKLHWFETSKTFMESVYAASEPTRGGDPVDVSDPELLYTVAFVYDSQSDSSTKSPTKYYTGIKVDKETPADVKAAAQAYLKTLPKIPAFDRFLKDSDIEDMKKNITHYTTAPASSTSRDSSRRPSAPEAPVPAVEDYDFGGDDSPEEFTSVAEAQAGIEEALSFGTEEENTVDKDTALEQSIDDALNIDNI